MPEVTTGFPTKGAMAAAYGYDISLPAANAKEAVQCLYFGYLAAIKTQNGAAMSVGRISTILDIAYAICKGDLKIYLLIDEYDNFTNTRCV